MTSAAVEFLQWLRPDGPWLLTAIEPESGKLTTKLLRNAEQVDAFVTEYNQACNIYYHVNATGNLGKRAKKDDIVAIEFMHTDLDPRDDEEPEAGKERYFQRLNDDGVVPTPSAIIDSGNGLNCLWRLTAPLPLPADRQQREQLIADVEERNRALVLVLGGSPETRNIDRILRLPGTTNFPNEAKRKRGRTRCRAKLINRNETRYQLGDFGKISQEENAKAHAGKGRTAFEDYIKELKDKIDFEKLPEVDAAKLPVSHHIKQLIDGIDEAMRAYRSRSEALMAALTAMAISRCSELMMAAVILKKPIGQHVRDRRSNSYAYLIKQIAKAQYYATRHAERRAEQIAHNLQFYHFRAVPAQRGYWCLPTDTLWNAADIDRAFSKQLVGKYDEGKESYIPSSKWLTQHARIDQLTWAPGELMFLFDTMVAEAGLIPRKGLTALNLNRGPRCAPGNAHAVRPWLDHVHKLYPDDADHIITWLAQRVQQPGVKINHVLVLGGAMRIGKDSILVPVRYAVGSWNFAEISPAELLGKFNPFLKKVLVRISEARDLGDVNRFTFYDHSKSLFASPPEVLRVNEKHIREYDVTNCVGFILTTNYRTGGIYLPPDDRRHYVAWSECKLEDFIDDYFSTLHNWYEEEGNRNVAAYLRQLDISAFDPKAPPKQTEAFWAMANHYRYESPVYAALCNVLEHLKYPVVVALHQLAIAEYLAIWLYDPKHASDIPRRMDACGYEKLRNPNTKNGLWKVDGRYQPVYGLATKPLADRMAAAHQLLEQPWLF
jgi:hypothetical protein